MELRGYDLRYLLTSLILDPDGTATTAELRLALTELGVDLGPDPRRRLYGALRSEARKGRLHPLGAGRYGIDELPRATRDRIRRHARNIELALIAGDRHPPRRPWRRPTSTPPSASPLRDASRPPAPTWLDLPLFCQDASQKARHNRQPRAASPRCAGARRPR